MRKLASIRKISEIKPIPNADAIEVAVVDGWNVVIKKGEYQVGDLAVYFEIDSWVPHDLAPFLSKGQEPKEFEGVVGNCLRTVKLRGQVSQGLLLPLSIIDSKYRDMLEVPLEGYDVTDELGIKKYEAPIPASLAGEVHGVFPSFISKTDQERVQNIINNRQYFLGRWEVTTKLDGSSMTMFIRDDTVGVCSRNLWLKDNEANTGNTLVRVANELQYKDVLPAVAQEVGFDFAVQGELMGPGIQKNREKLSKAQFFVFDIFNINEYRYLLPNERHEVLALFRAHGVELQEVPIVDACKVLVEEDVSINKFLEFADIPSLNHKYAEGVVFKSLDQPNKSFKVISNKYLLKEQ